jgi:outer membrane murein-binding lipoprotein Lpp
MRAVMHWAASLLLAVAAPARADLAQDVAELRTLVEALRRDNQALREEVHALRASTPGASESARPRP